MSSTMTGATTLIITAEDDTTADLVADALAVQGGKAVRIDVGISQSACRSPALLATTESGAVRSLLLTARSSS